MKPETLSCDVLQAKTLNKPQNLNSLVQQEESKNSSLQKKQSYQQFYQQRTCNLYLQSLGCCNTPHLLPQKAEGNKHHPVAVKQHFQLIMLFIIFAAGEDLTLTRRSSMRLGAHWSKMEVVFGGHCVAHIKKMDG